MRRTCNRFALAVITKKVEAKEALRRRSNTPLPPYLQAFRGMGVLMYRPFAVHRRV